MICECGNDQYYANQRCYHTIIVDKDGHFLDNVRVDDADKPYGQFECTKCHKEYEEL